MRESKSTLDPDHSRSAHHKHERDSELNLVDYFNIDQRSIPLKDYTYSRKVSPPGKDGIEQISAKGTYCSSPISNFFCNGYHKEQKYWIDKLSKKKQPQQFSAISFDNVYNKSS